MKAIEFESLNQNAASLIGKQWMMITAGKLGANGESDSCNTMTASWGGLGFMWNRPVAYVFVRPNRHTAPLINENESFTLSFMPEKYRKDLMFCGRNSGRDGNKFEQCELKPVAMPSGLVALQDADLVFECRKMYMQELTQAGFCDWSEVSPQWYEEGNPLHVMYVVELSQCWQRED